MLNNPLVLQESSQLFYQWFPLHMISSPTPVSLIEIQTPQTNNNNNNRRFCGAAPGSASGSDAFKTSNEPTGAVDWIIGLEGQLKVTLLTGPQPQCIMGHKQEEQAESFPKPTLKKAAALMLNPAYELRTCFLRKDAACYAMPRTRRPEKSPGWFHTRGATPHLQE